MIAGPVMYLGCPRSYWDWMLIPLKIRGGAIKIRDALIKIRGAPIKFRGLTLTSSGPNLHPNLKN